MGRNSIRRVVDGGSGRGALDQHSAPGRGRRAAISSRHARPCERFPGAPGDFSKNLLPPRIISCRRTIFRKIPSLSWLIERLPRISVFIFSPRWPRGTWAGSACRKRRTAWKPRCKPWADGAVPRPFLQLVRHTSTCVRSIPNMSPPLTAEISPANLLVLGQRLPRNHPETVRRLTLVRGSRRCDRFACVKRWNRLRIRGARTPLRANSSATRWMRWPSCSIRFLPARGNGPRAFVELRERAQTVADIAQTLAQELGEPADSELRTWAEAARACVESHAA